MSTRRDDDLRSVRVEVDGAMDGPLSRPEVVRSGGPPPVIVGAGLVAAAVVIIGLFALRPAEDASADGTERAVPTTTTVPEIVLEPAVGDTPSTTPDAPVLVSDADGADELGFGIADIVDTGVGYLALAPSQGFAPELFRSVDGVSWTRVEGVVVEGDPIDLFDRRWRDLTRTSDGFAVSASGQFLRQREVFISDIGVDWIEADDLQTFVDDGTRPLYPVLARGSSVTGFRLQTSTILEAILEEHTDLDEAPRGFCGVFPGREGSRAFQLMDCSFTSAGSLTPERIVSDLPAEQILACLGSLPDNAVSSEFVQTVGGSTGGAPSTETFGHGAGFDADIIELDTDRVAFLDSAPIPTNAVSCEGVVDIPDPVTPQVSVVDLESGTTELFDLPDELVETLSTRGAEAVRALGVAKVADDGDDHLVFVGGDDVWALNVDSGLWETLIRPSGNRPREPFDVTRMSVVGDRLFVLSGASLVAFELSEDDDGGLDLDFNSVVSNPDLPDDFAEGEIVFADEDALFITDGRSVWRYDVRR